MKNQWNNDPDKTFKECFDNSMQKVETCFMISFPLNVRQSLLFEWKIPDGLKPEDALLDLTKIMREAQYEKITPEEYALHNVIAQTTDKELKKELLKASRDRMDIATFTRTIEEYRQVELTILNDDKTDDTRRIGRVEKKGGQSGSRESSRERERGGYKGKNPTCFRCSASHFIKDCKEKRQECPVEGCSHDHFKRSHNVFITWRKNRERQQSPGRRETPGLNN